MLCPITLDDDLIPREPICWYFFRVRDPIKFLRQRWGDPETIAYPPSGGGRLVDYDVRFYIVDTIAALPGSGRKLVVVALVKGDLYVRIFSAVGSKVVDSSESRLIKGAAVDTLKMQVTAGLDVARLSYEERQKMLDNVVSVSDSKTLISKHGLILFEVSGWSDAAGHATLWDGDRCYDHCYFNEPGAKYRTDKAHFWGLS